MRHCHLAPRNANLSKKRRVFDFRGTGACEVNDPICAWTRRGACTRLALVSEFTRWRWRKVGRSRRSRPMSRLAALARSCRPEAVWSGSRNERKWAVTCRQHLGGKRQRGHRIGAIVPCSGITSRPPLRGNFSSSFAILLAAALAVPEMQGSSQGQNRSTLARPRLSLIRNGRLRQCDDR